MPWERHYKYFKPASGIPPHVVLYAYIKSLEVQVQDIPNQLERLLDRRQMTGPLSLDQIAIAVGNGPRISGMANDIVSLVRMVQAGAIAAGTPAAGSTETTRNRTATATARLHR